MNQPVLVSRRSFLQQGAVLAAGSALRLESAEPALSQWQIGCYTRPFDKHDYRAALDAIAEAGFKYAGIMTAKAKSWVLVNPETTPEEAAQIGEEVKQRGLKTASVYGDFRLAESSQGSAQVLRRLIDHCAACGSPDLMLGGTSDEKQFEAYYQTIAACCDYALEKRVRLTIKPHGGQNATGPQCRKAIQAVGHGNFGLWYDPGNILYYSDGALDPVEDAASVDGLVVGMSVKDFRPPKDVMVTPGTGVVDFPKVLARLYQGGFRRGPLVVECLAAGDLTAVKAEATKARVFLERVLQELKAPSSTARPGQR
jgi:sugar phosphate isomerase/epimerase